MFLVVFGFSLFVWLLCCWCGELGGFWVECLRGFGWGACLVSWGFAWLGVLFCELLEGEDYSLVDDRIGLVLVDEVMWG